MARRVEHDHSGQCPSETGLGYDDVGGGAAGRSGSECECVRRVECRYQLARQESGRRHPAAGRLRDPVMQGARDLDRKEEATRSTEVLTAPSGRIPSGAIAPVTVSSETWLMNLELAKADPRA